MSKLLFKMRYVPEDEAQEVRDLLQKNNIEFFETCVPTAENIALHIADKLKHPIKNIGADLHKIRLQESPNNAAEIYTESVQLNSF